MCKMQIAVARATQVCRPNVGAIYRLITVHAPFLVIEPNQKNPQQLLYGSPESLTGDEKFRVLHEVLPKNTIPTRVASLGVYRPLEITH